MKKEEEKRTVFWCDLFGQVIYSEIEPELTHRHGELASREVVFSDGRVRKPSLFTLKRKPGGFGAFGRKVRNDRGKARTVSDEIVAIIELKKEQPLRSPRPATVSFRNNTVSHSRAPQFIGIRRGPDATVFMM